MCIQDTKHTTRPIASALGQRDLSWVLMKEDIFKQLNLPAPAYVPVNWPDKISYLQQLKV